MTKRRKSRKPQITPGHDDITLISAADAAVLAVVKALVQFLEIENFLVEAEFVAFLEDLADDFEEQEINPILVFFFRAHILAMKPEPEEAEGEA
jgi:hypothetical protein